MSLKDTLIARIESVGPMLLSDYMRACNAHYYATHMPFGVAGDFITAPEISQAFGELIGLWVADLWQRAGAPAAFDLVELGPGRGTLMADALRATAKVPGFHQAMKVHLVESSPRLREEQAKRVPQAHCHESIDSLPHGPMIVIANEFFDALAIDQTTGGVDRRIAVKDERLVWHSGVDATTRETSAESVALCSALSARLAKHGGAMLIIDYGDMGGSGDTLQAVKGHGYADPLDAPGEQDLTAHVDFAALRDAASSAGCLGYGPVPQGAFLQALGLDLRTRQLARSNPERANNLLAGSKRLAHPDAMGTLFKVLCISATHWPKPAGLP